VAKQKTETVPESQDETGLEQQDEAAPEQPAPKEPEQEFRHGVLEDCIIDGIYRTKGEIILSARKLVPHCSLIE
jgi:hypothetical protein